MWRVSVDTNDGVIGQKSDYRGVRGLLRSEDGVAVGEIGRFAILVPEIYKTSGTPVSRKPQPSVVIGNQPVALRLHNVSHVVDHTQVSRDNSVSGRSLYQCSLLSACQMPSLKDTSAWKEVLEEFHETIVILARLS